MSESFAGMIFKIGARVIHDYGDSVDFFPVTKAGQAVQSLGKPAAALKVPGSNPG